MGQLIGKAQLTDESRPFANLSTEAIQESWDKFNEVAEGFGVSMDVFKSICGVLVEEVALGDEDVLSDYAEAIFRTFDTDENDLVDALEFLASFAMISGMDLVGKVKFMFDCYDFDESGQLTIDEMTLSLKSTITGLAKLTGQEPPTEQDLETISQDAFRTSDLDSDQKISFEEFLSYCRINPEVRSFVDYYDAVPEHWGAWDELNNMEVATEMERTRLTARQLATVDGLDYCGLIPGESNQLNYSGKKVSPSEMTALKKVQTIAVARPWMDESLQPATAEDDLDFSSPSQAVSVEWIYGYTGQRLRNNCRYSLEGDIMYPVGSIVVVYNKVRHAQKYYTGHRGEVLSLAIHPEGRIVASGDGVEPCPCIDIWDSSDRTRKHVLRGIHRMGVTLLSFSPDGSRLATVGMDSRHLLIIYDWQNETALFSCACGPNKVLDCQFVDQTHLVTCGINHAMFWSAVQSGSSDTGSNSNSSVQAYEGREGLFGPKFKKQALTCVCPIPAIAGKVATGTVSGEIYVWDGRKVCASLDAHDGPCTVIHAASTGVLSGGSEGKIILWSPELEQLATFDMHAVSEKTCSNNALRSLCFSGDGTRMLSSVDGCEVYELAVSDGSDVNAGALVRGHDANMELHGCASHPTRNEFVTAGDDGSVRIWDIETHKCLRMCYLKGAGIRCVTYSPDGTKLCVGTGTPNDTTRYDGTFRVINEQTMQVMYESKDAEAWVTDVLWSPEGDTLAVASADGNIYLYNNDDYAIKGRCGGHVALSEAYAESTKSIGSKKSEEKSDGGSTGNTTGVYPLKIDFDENGQWVRSNDTEFRLVYHSAATGEHNKNGFKELKNTIWSSQRCTIGWPVRGIWPVSDDGASITSCTLTNSDVSNDSKTLLVTDDVGRLRIYHYPVPPPETEQQGGDGEEATTITTAAAVPLEYRAHVGPCTNVASSYNDGCMITVGGNDAMVVQWQVTIDMLEETAALADEPEEMFAPLQIKPLVSKNYELKRQFDIDFALSLEEKVPELPESKERDDYMSENHPWWKVAVPPSNPVNDPLLKDAPKSSLKLGWVFGNSASWLRQSIRYLHGNEIVYPAGEVMVAYAKGEHKQRHALGHTYEITAIAVAPDGITVATSQAGTRPNIVIWDTKNMSCKRELKGLHRDVVRHLRFSQPDGARLISVGQDYCHTIGIWDVSTGQLLAQTRGGEAKVFDIQWQPNGGGGAFVQVGFQHIKFHVLRGRNIDTEMGVFGDERDHPFTTMMCVGYVKGGCAVAGGTDGALFKFEGRNLDVVVPEAHSGGPVNVIHTCSDRILTGGFDGKVRMWSSPDLDLVGDFDMSKLNPYSMVISSLDLSADGDTILVGNEGCELFEISAKDGSNVHGENKGPVATGHCTDSVMGICVHPTNKNIIVTTGDDMTVRKWDISTKKMLAMIQLDAMARAVTYSPDGNYIAVGLGGLVTGKDPVGPIGGFKVLQDEDLAIAIEGRDARQWVTSIKFSPDGRGMALSSRDGKLYLYDVEDAYKLGNVFKKAKGAILRFDYSDDSTFIQLNDETGQLLFCDATTGMQIPSANELRDLDWGSLTCTMQWNMRGCWPARTDASGTNAVSSINAVAVSEKIPEGSGASEQQQLLARFDPDGLVTVFNYPCTQLGAIGTSYSGHATNCTDGTWAGEGFTSKRTTGVGGVSEGKDGAVEEGKGEEIKMLPGNKYLVTIGGRDRCVMRWDCIEVDADVDAQPYEPKQTDGSLLDMGTILAYQKDGTLQKRENDDRQRMNRETLAESKKDVPRGFIGNVVDPSDPQPHDPMPPQIGLTLEHIYGASMQESGRNNVFYGGAVSGSNIVYVAGKYGVVYTKDGNKQTFFNQHDDDITCLDIDPPTGRFAVSGQRGINPIVKVWNIDTATEICTMPKVHRGAIVDVKFNKAGTYVASVGMGDSYDPSYTLCIYSDPNRSPVGTDWSGGAILLARRQIGVEPVMVTHFIDRVQASHEFDLFTGGETQVCFWEHSGKVLTPTRGIFDRTAKIQPQCSACTLGDALVTGCANGQLYVWNGSKVRRVVPAHRGMVSTMQTVGTEKMVTGSRDGTIKIWDRSLEIIRTFDMKTMATQSSVKPHVRSVCMDRTLERIVVGLASSDIYEICYASGSATLLSRGHFEGELWGLAPHPTESNLVATSGDDTTVRVWDTSLHEMVQIANVEAPCRAVEWSPRGDLIGLGTGSGAVDKGDGEEEKSGAIVLLNAETLEIVHEGRDSREWIHLAKFSPDGKLFIVGSDDKELLVYDIAKGFKLKSKCQKHGAPIIAADFDKSSTWIRSNCSNNDLNYFRANNGEVNAGGASDLKDEEWDTFNTPCRWGTQGAWLKNQRRQTNSSDVSKDGRLLALLSENGKLEIFKHPCVDKGAQAVVVNAHAVHGTTVRFSADGKYIYTVGGRDRLLMQWRVDQLS